MKSAIYVPSMSITNQSWLVSNFFLWDNLYRITPAGFVPGKQVKTEFEKQLSAMGSTFIRNIDCQAVLDSAYVLYQGMLESLMCQTLPNMAEYQKLAVQYAKEVEIHRLKLDPRVEKLWLDNDIPVKASKVTLKVPQFWADLWLVALAVQKGRADDVQPISDDPLGTELIRLSGMFDFDTGTQIVDSHKPTSQMASLFFQLGLPGIQFTANDLSQAIKWQKAKRQFVAERQQYFNWLDETVAQVPVYLEHKRSLEALMQQARQEQEAMIKAWRPHMKDLGVNLKLWSVTALFQYVAAPSQLTMIAAGMISISSVYSISTLLKDPKAKGPLCYEYKVSHV